jgi:hypothetical protein
LLPFVLGLVEHLVQILVVWFITSSELAAGMVWISFVVVLALQHLVQGRYADPPIPGNNGLDGKNTTGTVQRDFEMQPAEGWRDAMLLSATPWGVGTTMYPLMPP